MDDENRGCGGGGSCKIVNVLEKELRNYLRIKITRQNVLWLKTGLQPGKQCCKGVFLHRGALS